MTGNTFCDMKKYIITLIAAVFAVVSVSAQDAERPEGVTTKKGYNVLPAAGDFALGIDATPLIKSVALGNNNTPSFGYDGKIYGKYFVADNRAIRFGIMMDIGSNLDRYAVANDTENVANPLNPYDTTFDTTNYSNTMVGIFGGYEWRRGYGRLQAFWGGEACLSFSTTKTTYEYGNPMTKMNQAPTTYLGNLNSRLISQKGSNGFSAGVRGFVGVEVFIARKISIGGELGLGFNYGTEGQITNTTESYNAAKDEIEQISMRNAGYNGGRAWNFGTDVSSNIFMMFHF